MGAESLVRAIAEESRLESLAQTLQEPISRALQTAPTVRTLAAGTWLGHPVHAALTDVPIGAWTAGVVLDLLELAGNGDRAGRGDAVHAVGLAGALAAAATGLADWSYTAGPARRIGVIHGATNAVAATLFGASLVARRRGYRGTGILLSTLGYAGVLFSGWLGGELAYRYGTGVSRAAFQERGPEAWIAVLDEAEAVDGRMRRVQVDGVPVLVVQREGRIHAIGDRCTHMGCSLSEGRLEADRVICTCHGSQFRLGDGRAVVGPATDAAQRFDVRVRNGRVEVRAPGRSDVQAA